MSYTLLQRRQRAAARTALYLSCGVVGVAACLLLPLLEVEPIELENQEWASVDYASFPEVQLLQRFLQIDTSAATGDEVRAARFLAAELERAGVAAVIERLEDRRANLWAIVEGSERPALVLHSHLDTEPIVHPEAWAYPPYGGVIDPPWIYGRGAFDMKSVTIAQLLAFVRIADRPQPPRRSVIFLATSSEEAGSDLGTRWVIAQHPELVARFWTVLTEDGVVEGRDPSDVKYWGTEFAQKRFVDLRLCSEDRDRLEEIRELVMELGRPETGLRLPAEARRFLAVYAPTRDRATLRDILRRPERVVDDPSAFEELPPYLQSMFRSELVPFPVEEAEGGGFELLLKFHLLPGADLEEVRRELLPDWITHGVSATLIDVPSSAKGSSLEHPVFQSILEQLAEDYPGVVVGPFLLPWTATDARFFRLAGVPTFGFSPFLVLTPETLHIGTSNEKIALPGFVAGVERYCRLLDRLVG